MRADKLEAKLKALVKAGANRRCVNCDSVGPQYVVCSFNVFVCTVCSGVHRQFGHRVKGVSMSTFKEDEVAVLEASGNEKFNAFFLNKWTPAALPKPTDRDVHRVHSWISAIYQDRRFYAEPAGGWTGGAAALSVAGSSTSEGREPAVRPLSEVLGADTPKLNVQGSGALERTASAVSSSAGAATPSRTVASNGPSSAAAGASLLGAPSPQSARSAPPAPAAPAAAWDPFGDAAPAASSSPAAAAPAPAPASHASPRSASAPAPDAAWASFGDTPVPQAVPATSPAAAQPAPAAAAERGGGWEAFGDGAGVAAAPAAAAAAPPAAPAAAAAPPGSSSPAPQPKPVMQSSRPEVPMDVFYPEFERIRATGMLPTGQPVPLPAFPPSYGAAPPRPAGAPGGPYAPYGYPGAAAGYGAAPAGGRPTIAIPPAPLHPGFGYGPSPAARPGMPSPAYSASPGYSPAGSLVSPAGSGYSVGGAANGGAYGVHDPGAHLRGSAGSLSELMPGGGGAPTPAGQQRLGEAGAADPFAGLAPGLRGALPAVANGGSGGKYGAAAPPPMPAGLPPFHATGPPQPQYGGYGAAAAPYAGAPSPAGLAPAAAAASATLFGRTPSLTGYDLGAPAAPKPQASGNPFA